MKELSIEEKAKAYDEALQRTRRWYDSNTNEGFREIFEDIFPILKESEDERIRKEIRDFICWATDRGSITREQLEKSNSWLAWLENQAKNNMGISEATKQKLEDNLNKALEKETPESCNEFLEKQGEQRPVFKMKIPEESLGISSDDYKKIVDECIYGDDKPAWSEEDKKGLGDALWCCKQAASIAKDENDMGNAWYAENWLKSLSPQNRWKPSEEQIEALRQAAYEPEKNWSEELQSLYCDLRKI